MIKKSVAHLGALPFMIATVLSTVGEKYYQASEEIEKICSYFNEIIIIATED